MRLRVLRRTFRLCGHLGRAGAIIVLLSDIAHVPAGVTKQRADARWLWRYPRARA